MRKIEHKVVKKYPKPNDQLIKNKSVNQNMDMGNYDESIFPNVKCSVTQRLLVLYGPNARDYARSQIHYRRFADIKSWKAIALPGKMYICRERLIAEYLDDQRKAFARNFLERYGIPFSPDFNIDLLKTMGIVK